MKKLVVVVGIVIIAVCGFGFAEETEKEIKNTSATRNAQLENFKKAGQTLLQRQEAMLSGFQRKIDNYIQLIIPEDGRVSGKEVRTLRKEIKRFNGLKAEAEKRLKIYGLATETAIPKELESAISFYLTHDRDNKIRIAIAGLIGKDLPIGRSIIWFLLVFAIIFSF